MRIVPKVVVYLTSGDDLVTFTQPDFPEAGTQVPAGTIQPGEDPLVAAVREATEETGLTGFGVPRALGTHMYDARPWGKDEWHERTFVHLPYDGPRRATWEHLETDPHGGGDAIRFSLRWTPIGGAGLIADGGAFLHAVHPDT